MNDVLSDLEIAAPWVSRRVRRVPGPVTGLWCGTTRAGGLMFAWHRPSGSTPVDGYCIERTRDGLSYEEIGRVTPESFVLPDVLRGDGWFYRVTAINTRGQGPARWVIFYLRRRRDSILQHVPVRPGLRVNICELISR